MHIEIPDDLRITEEQARLDFAVGLDTSRSASLARAASLAGLSRIEFQRILAERDIPLAYDSTDLNDDIATPKRLGAALRQSEFAVPLMLVVRNTSPITNLVAVGHLDLLQLLQAQGMIPEEVRDELVLGGSGDNPSAREITSEPWFTVVDVDAQERVKTVSRPCQDRAGIPSIGRCRGGRASAGCRADR